MEGRIVVLRTSTLFQLVRVGFCFLIKTLLSDSRRFHEFCEIRF